MSDSDLERKVSLWLESRRDVVCVRDQWPAVPYYGADGKRHVHTFDYHVELRDGTSRVVPVKPASKAAALLPVLRRIQRQGTLAPFADGISLITDEDVTDDIAANAENIVRARKMRDDQEHLAALADVADIQGTVRFYDLVRHARQPALRRNALWRLIDEGILVPDDPAKRIVDTTEMRIVRASHPKER